MRSVLTAGDGGAVQGQLAGSGRPVCIYGVAVLRPEPMVRITVFPTPWWAGLAEFWHEVVVPAFLFAVGYTAFALSLGFV